MRFGIFYEHQLPRPWTERSELADRLGYDYAWEVEHNFPEEYSHSSAPEVFLGAASQRTQRTRLRHGIIQLTTNHPIRVADRVATLDLLSRGRVELGLGEGQGHVRPHRRGGAGQGVGLDVLRLLPEHYGRHGIAGPGRHMEPLPGLAEDRAGSESPGQRSHRLARDYPETLRQFEAAHVDQVILLNQAGMTTHDDICASLELFASEVMPEFHAREPEPQRWKDDVLAGRIDLEDLDTAGYRVYSYQNEDIVRLSPEMSPTGPTPELMKTINAAFNARDPDRIAEFFAEDATALMARGPEPVRGEGKDGEKLEYQGCDIYEFRGDKILNKDTYWKIVEERDRL